MDKAVRGKNDERKEEGSSSWTEGDGREDDGK